jgi:Ca2+-binding RTX toxin-like protein
MGTDSLANVENVTIGGGNDTVSGSAAANVIDGGAGNDVIDGGAGNDTLVGGDGTDTVTFASSGSAVAANLGTGTSTSSSAGTDALSGFENLTGSAYNDTLTGDAGNNVIDGGAGNDVIAGGAGDDTLIGGAGTDTVDYTNASGGVNVNLAAGTAAGADGNDTISSMENATGSSFDDIIAGNASANTLTGGAGDDTFVGSAGNDALIGGAGADTADYSTWTANQNVNLAAGTMTDGTNAQTLSGIENVEAGSGNDVITGSSGDNVIDAGAGNDTIDAGLGDDTIAGGAGTDTVTYATSSSGVTVDLGAGTAGGGAGNDTISGVENVIGTAAADTITGNAENNVIDAGAGNDVVGGSAGSDTLVGGAGTDTVEYSNQAGSVSVDLAAGTATKDAGGTDALSGFENATGGAGNDTLAGDGGNNVLNGGAGNDTLVGGGGDDTIVGGSGVDTVDYSAAAGAVSVNLGTGAVSGAAGNDTVSETENVVATSFNDTIAGDAAANQILAGAGNDTVDGGAGNDVLHGEAGNDVLSGGSGDDTIFGGSGDDTLRGGAGDDILVGGDATSPSSGNDVLDYSDVATSITVDLTAGGDASSALPGYTGAVGSATGADIGSDSIVGISSVVGGGGDDTYAFSHPTAGSTYTVDGGGGSNTIDLSNFTRSQIDFSHGAGTLVVNLPEGGQATINYSNVSSLHFADCDMSAYDFGPSADAGADQAVGEGGAVTLSASGEDPEGSPLTYTWSQTSGPSVAMAGATTATPSFTAPDLASNTTLTFRVAVSDGINTTFDTVNVVVNADDDAPTVEAGPSQTVDEGDAVQLTATSSDPEGQGIAYTWTQIDGPTVALNDATAATPSFEAPNTAANTTLTFQVAASDGTNVTYDTVTVVVNADEDAPSVDAGATQSVEEGSAVTLGATASDPEGQGLTYGWTQTGGPAVELSNADGAAPSFTAPNMAANTTLTFQVAVSDGAHTVYDTVSVLVNADDDAPSADAGANQSVDEGATVSLAATSTDPEGQGLTYAWTQTNGPAVTLSGANGATPSFTAPELPANTTLTFQVAVSDGTSTTYDTVNVLVNADDDAPAVDAGPDLAASEGGHVGLAVTASDPEGQELTYVWTQTSGPAVSLAGTGSATPSFTAPELAANTTLTFQVAVSDGTTTTYDTVNVVVNADDDAPIVDAGVDQAVTEGTTVSLAATASDPEAQGLSYAWTQTNGPAVTLSGGNGATPSFTAPDLPANTTLTFQVAVSDGSNTTYDTVNVLVNADDDAPSVDAGLNQSVDEGATVSLAATASDPEGQGLTYTWTQTSGPSVILSNANGATPNFTAPDMAANTTLTFQVAVSDGTNTTYDTVNVVVNADDDAPSVDAGVNQSVDEGATVSLSAIASDPEGQGLTYTWTQTSGPAVTLSDADGATPSFTAPDMAANTTLTFQVAVSDGTNTTYDTVNVLVNADDDAPSVDAGVNQSVDEGATVSLSASASDPEGQGLSYTWTQTSGPAVTLSGADGATPTFTAPDMAANTTLTFQVAVSDGTNTTYDTVNVLVNADDDAPSVEAGLNQSVDEGATVSLSASASDPEGQGLTYTWTQTSGPSVILSNASGATPSFTAPDMAANTTLTFQVAVSDGTNTTYDTVNVLVNADDDAPSVDAGMNQSVDEGATVSLSAIASDPEGQGLTYTWTQTSGPAVTLSGANGATPSFTAPDMAANTTLTFQVAVSDGTNTTFDTVNVLVNADDDAPSVDAGMNQSVDEGATVSLAATASDPEGQGLTYTWTQTSGPAVTLSGANGATPSFTAPDMAANTTLTFQVAVSDGTNTTYDTVNVLVNADDDAPSVDAGLNQSVDEGATVSLAATASDPEGQGLTYTWTQTSGPAVTLSGADGATPSFTAPDMAANTALTFQVAVSDGTNTTYDTVNVLVNADDDAPSVDAGLNQSVDEGATVSLAATASDPEGQGLTYTWTQTSGPAVTLSGANGATPSFAAPNLPANATLTFQVAVSDGTNTTFDTVSVLVNASNDAPTDVTLEGGTLSESASPGDLVGSVRVADADTSGHTFALRSDADGRFVIDGATGDIRVAPGARFDFETTPAHTLTVQVTDGEGAVVERSFTVSLSDASEAPDSIAVEHGRVPATSADGHVVGRAAATDPDVGDTLRYELVGGNGAFAVDGETGVITVADASALRSLAGGGTTVTVRATDADGQAVETTVEIAVDALPPSEVPSTGGDDDRAATPSAGPQAPTTEVVVHYDVPQEREGETYEPRLHDVETPAIEVAGASIDPLTASGAWERPIDLNPADDVVLAGPESSRLANGFTGDFERAFVALTDGIRLDIDALNAEAQDAAQSDATAPTSGPQSVTMLAALWGLVRGAQAEQRSDRDSRTRGSRE